MSGTLAERIKLDSAAGPTMSIMTPLNSTALQILQQPNALAGASSEQAPMGAGVLAGANGIMIPGVSNAQSQARAKISDALFDRPIVNIEELKVNLMQRLGEELGVAMDDYKDDPWAHASALRLAVAKAKLDSNDGGVKFVAELEKKLGLDKLGITLDELISAVGNPDGEASRKLNEALREETAGDAKAAIPAVKTNANGLYEI